MSVTLQVPPAMENEAREYAAFCGLSMEEIVFDCLRRVIRERRMRQKRASDLEAFVRCNGVNTGEPHRYTRSDAYEEELG